jgi:predicted transcriptional regulator
MAEQLNRTREILELVSRAVETNPDASAPTIRVRAHVRKQTGDKALELLLRAGFIERERVDAQDTYRSVRPYRASVEAPRTAFAETHATRQGGGG